MEDGSLKKQRAAAEPSAAPPQPQAPPQSWPSRASLYEQGLQCKAEVQGPADSSMQPGAEWIVPGAAWRSGGFGEADSGRDVLRRRQAEAKRSMMPK